MRSWGSDEVNDEEASDSILFLNLMLADLIQGIGLRNYLFPVVTSLLVVSVVLSAGEAGLILV